MTFPLPTITHLNRALDRAGRRPCLPLILLCLVLWLPGFFTLPPGDRDESRFAQATKQMLETGDAVQIRNGLVGRNQKPIGIYWLQLPFAAAARAAHVATSNPIWPYRMPSLLGGLLAVLATYRLGRRLVGDRGALLAAGFLAASVSLTVEVHIAKTDAALLGATVLAMGVLSRAYLAPDRLRPPLAMLFWTALGVGILLKGPIAPMVAGLAIAWLALLDRKRGAPRWLWSLRPKWGAALLLAIVLPWCIAIGIATHGRFFAQSVGGDMAGKLAGSDDAHGGIFGLHLLLLPPMLFAGGIAALCAIPATWRGRREPAIRFLVAWIVPNWLVFEAVTTKLPHYTLPLYPAIALLAARWMLSNAPDRRRPWFGAALAIGVTALFGATALLLPEIILPGLHPADALGLPAAIIAALLIRLLLRVWPDPRRAVLLLLCGAPFLFASILGVELPNLWPLWIAPRVEAILEQHWPSARPTAGFAELGFAEPSLMFLCGTDTQLLTDAAGAARFLAEDRQNVVAVEDRSLGQFLAQPGPAPIPLGTVAGYNYSRGRRVTLSLFASPASGSDQRMK